MSIPSEESTDSVSGSLAQASFFRLALHPIKFRLFLLTRLPSAFFTGLRIKDIDAERSAVTVPYKWFSKNPFRSTYFACLAMAAEMSTGVLAMAHIQGRKPGISMLVIGMEATFFKKATGSTRFQCTDGALICQAIGQAAATGEAATARVCSVGTSATGEVIAEFFITWSFKQKKA